MVERKVVTKAVFIQELKKLGFSHTEAKKKVESFVANVQTDLMLSKKSKINKCGSLIVHSKNARPGRNPKTKKPVLIKARNTVLFRVAKSLKSYLKLKAELEKS